MGKPHTEEEWVEEISREVDESLQKFDANHQYKEAMEEVLKEVYYYGGAAALDEVGEFVLEMIENKRHPKTNRIRGTARSLLINEYDADISASSPLMRSRNG